MPSKQSDSGATTGYEAELWAMADTLRGSMDAGEYKHVVVGLHLPQVHHVAATISSEIHPAVQA